MNLYLIALLSVITVFTQVAEAAPTEVPRFEPSECAIAVPAAEKHVECGYLVVREDRSTSGGRTIRLPIVILKTESNDRKNDAVLKTLGGPGGSSLRMIGGRRSSPWLKDRDYIIFEQRGTRYAQPSLECPEVDEANAASARDRLNSAKARLNLLAAAKACHNRLTQSGIDLSSYNSAESAADIEDLRRVLKLDKINLYGISYSARLMLDVMRYYPAGIRSVVLESTLPPEINYDEVGVDAVVRSLDEMFAACRLDADCSAAYPQLEQEFYAVVARLNANPVSVGTKDPRSSAMVDIKLDGDDFATWIVDYLFSNEPSATVNAPYAIHQTYSGNVIAPFKSYAADKIGTAPYSWGMRYSVWCSEEMPFESPSAIRAQSYKYPGLKGYEVMSVPDVCSVWKVRRAKPVANRPVTSNIPTLVIGAQYDAYTAPEWGRSAAKRLKNSFVFEVPWAGHGPGFSVPCVSGMIAEFFENPMRSPGAECIEKTRTQFKFLVRR